MILFLLALCATSAAQTPEAAALGGSCLSEGDPGFAGLQWHALVRRHAELLRRGDRDSAVELAKRIVRSRCSNEYWWLKLAEELFEIGREEQSVAALEALYNRRSNAVDRRLHTPDSPLNRLLESAVYWGSALAPKLAEDRRALKRRRNEARARLAVESRPPENYVAKPACPFECCHFGSWSVREDTTLYDRPEGARAVGRALQGERVEALTGEVHLRPLPVRVRYSSPYGFTAEEGSIVFLLDYLGEGHGRAWVKGKVVETDIVSVYGHCAFPGPGCWGEFVDPEDAGRRRYGVWWVQIQTGDGLVGWTKEAENFGGKDACA